jgi:tetratricopeptide (TPR) repeat protein
MFKQVETLEGFRGLSRYWTALEDHMKLNLGLTLLRASQSWLIDKTSPESLLLSTTLVRFLVYCTRYEQAEKIACSTLHTVERQYGEAHVESMKARNLLASIYTLQSRYKDSLAHYEKNLQVFSIGGRKNKQEHYIDALSGSAENFYYLSDYVNALPRFELVFKSRTSHLGPNHEKTLHAANNIANVHLESGDYAKALDLHRKNVKHAQRILGTDHPSLALYTANFANALEKSGNDAEAINRYKSSIDIYEKSLGLLASDLTLPLGNLGLLLQRNGKLEEARKLQQRCVNLMRLTLGSHHRETVRGLVNLAAVTEDIEKRKMLLDEACTVAFDILGDHPFTAAALGSYAWALVEDDDLSQAHIKLLESHDMLARFLPKDHYQVIESIFALAQLNYNYIDDDEQALVYLKECFELQMSKTDLSSSKLSDVCLMIAWILCSQDNLQEAASTLTSGISHLEQSTISININTTTLYKELAKIKTNMGENAEVISIYNQVIAKLLQSTNPDVEEVCQLYFDLGAVYEAHDDPVNASLAYESSLRHAIELRGEDDIILTNIWVSLAATQEARGNIREAIKARERVESLIRNVKEINEDLQAQRSFNLEVLTRLYGLVKD